MATRARHRQDRPYGRHTVVIVAGVALLSLVLSGCAQLRANSGPAGQPPKLHLVTGAGAAGRDAAPAGLGIGGFDGYVLVGSLPDQPTRAAVFRWPAGPATTTDVQRLAKALGVTGTPVRHGHGWVVDGATGVLRIRDGGGHEWSFTRADRADCPPVSVDVDNADGASGMGCGMAVSPGQPEPTGPPDSTTRSLAAPLLAALGFAPSDAEAATVYVSYPDSTLSVSPTVAGMPTQGIQTSVYVDKTGITGAVGRLNRPLAGDVYPLRTAKQAFEDLGNGPRSLMEPYCGPIPDQTDSAPGATPPPPMPCGPTPVPVQVTGARIGLLLTYDTQDPGAPVLVPAWFFAVAGDVGEPAVIAIDPAYLAPPGQVQVPGGVTGGGSGGGPVGPGGSVGSGGSAGSAGPKPPATPDGPPEGVPASPKR